LSLLVRGLAGLATFQDAGRPGLRHFGVPPSGIWDQESAALANALVGNPPTAAIVELALGVIEMEATETIAIAWVGSGADGRRIVRAGETARIGPPRRARIALAAPGGFDSRLVMDSASGVSVAVGTVLTPKGSRLDEPVSLAEPPTTFEAAPFRLLPGPQADRFDLAALGEAYRVSILSDRVGIRLEGTPLRRTDEIVSEPACPGTVQIAGDGQPIILGPDGPTIGGYPKIGVVCRADFDRLSQLRPGDSFVARWTDLDEARAAAEAREARLKRQLAAIRLSLAS